MGFGGGNFAGQDAALVASMLQQFTGLQNQQSASAATNAANWNGILGNYMASAAQAMGITPMQQRKTVLMGQMDFIKTNPTGLSGSGSTISPGLIGR